MCIISSSYVNSTGVTVRKRLSWVLTSATLTFYLWPWPFAWTLLWSLVITPKKNTWWCVDGNILKNVWQTDRQTGKQTENTIHRAAWSQLKQISRVATSLHSTESVACDYLSLLLVHPAIYDPCTDADKIVSDDNITNPPIHSITIYHERIITYVS